MADGFVYVCNFFIILGWLFCIFLYLKFCIFLISKIILLGEISRSRISRSEVNFLGFWEIWHRFFIDPFGHWGQPGLFLPVGCSPQTPGLCRQTVKCWVWALIPHWFLLFLNEDSGVRGSESPSGSSSHRSEMPRLHGHRKVRIHSYLPACQLTGRRELTHAEQVGNIRHRNYFAISKCLYMLDRIQVRKPKLERGNEGSSLRSVASKGSNPFPTKPCSSAHQKCQSCWWAIATFRSDFPRILLGSRRLLTQTSAYTLGTAIWDPARLWSLLIP